MRRTPARQRTKNPWKLLVVGAILILCVTLLSFLFIHETVPTRIGVVIVGNPTVVFSYDQSRKSMTAVSIPPDTYVDMVRGYGSYPISSVWKLDHLDKRNGVLLTETVEEATGIPVRFFIHLPSEGSVTDDIGARIAEALSFGTLIRSVFQKGETNIPIGILFDLSRAFKGMGPTDTTYIHLSNNAVFTTSTLADGTPIKKIDPGKLALLIGTHAEDADIRKENMRISVFNSTDTGGLAQKATRTMETLGFHVRSISNTDLVKPSMCSIKAKKELHRTNTVKTLQWLYKCTIEDDDSGDSQSDVTLIIGTDFENRFLPF